MKKLIALLALLASPCFAQHYVGDFAPGATVCRFFSTYQPSTGAAFALASGAVDVYQEGSDTQDTDDSGVTLTASVDSMAGSNRICVDTSSDGTFYAAGRMVTVVLSAGTVDSVSVVGTPILSFSLNKTAALRPTTAGREIGVESDGDLTKVNTLDGHTAQTGDAFARLGAPAGASTAADIAAIAALLNAYRMGIINEGTLQDVAADGATLASAAAFEDGTLEGAMLLLTNGTYAGSRVFLSGNTGDAVTFTEWPGGVTPTGTPTYVLFGTAPSVGAGGGDATEANQDLILADTASLLSRLSATRAGYLDNLSGGAVATASALSSLQTDVTTLLGRLTSARAGYLDNLDVGGDVASSAEIAAIDSLIDALTVIVEALNDLSSGDVQTAVRTAQGLITGTCDSGSTTTCVDDALTQADETQLDDRLILFDDGWTARITGFTPGTDTLTTTKVAPSTRASKVYIIFPMTAD